MNQLQKEPKWHFDNSYARLPKVFAVKQNPTPVRAPKMAMFNRALADSLGVPCTLEVFVGNVVPDGAESLAQAYAGHQYGHFRMLGDGRAVLLGEHVTDSGERFDIQLKYSAKRKRSNAVFKGRGRACRFGAYAARIYHQRGDGRLRGSDDKELGRCSDRRRRRAHKTTKRGCFNACRSQSHSCGDV